VLTTQQVAHNTLNKPSRKLVPVAYAVKEPDAPQKAWHKATRQLDTVAYAKWDNATKEHAKYTAGSIIASLQSLWERQGIDAVVTLVTEGEWVETYAKLLAARMECWGWITYAVNLTMLTSLKQALNVR